MIDDVLDLHIAKAVDLSERDLSSVGDILATIRSRGKSHNRRTALIAAGVAAIVVLAGTSLAAASAFGLFRTVPTQIHVTQPGSNGSSQGINGVKVGHEYTTSIGQAEAIAGFQILTLGGQGSLQSVTVVPPLTLSDGQPIQPGEILKPSIVLDYVVNGTSVQFIEDPVTPGSSLQFSVKWYGAPTTHQATIDGIHLIWQGANENDVDLVAFQTTSGTLVYMTSGEDATSGPTPGNGTTFSLAAYAALIAGMS